MMDYRRDFHSKLFDGLLPALVLYLAMLVIMQAEVIASMFGGAGLLVYQLGLLAVAMFSLQRALAPRFSETARGWYGMAGGLLAWSVFELGQMVEKRSFSGPTMALTLIMAVLVTGLLWQRFLPVGARFFLATCLAYCAGHMMLAFSELLSSWSPVLLVLYRGIGFLSLAGAVGAQAWMFLFTDRRMQRMWGALGTAVLAVAAYYVLRTVFG
jgi:hypothetical protein